MSRLFTSGGQSIRASSSASVLPMNIPWGIFIEDFLEDSLIPWFPWGLTSFILQSKGLPSVFSSTIQKDWFLGTQHFYSPALTSIHKSWKNHGIQNFADKLMSLLFHKFIIAFPSSIKHLLTSWLQSQSAVIWESKKIKFVTVSTFSLQFSMKWWDQMPWFYFIFFNTEFQASFFTLFHPHQEVL